MGMRRGNNISFRNFGKTIQSNYIRFFGTTPKVLSPAFCARQRMFIFNEFYNWY